MKLKTFALLGVICTSVVFTSCKKDDDKKEETPAASIEGTWKMTAQTMTVNLGTGDTTMNTYADMEACEKDDLVRFNADKTVTNLAGATKCDPSEPTSESGGTWALSSDQKTLTVTDGSPDVFTVVTLNTTTLKLKMTDSSRGMTYVMNATFTKQ